MASLPEFVKIVDVGPRDGTVAELLFAPGDQVSEGGELLTLE
jgi:biotin carboxyl carrier protein